LDLLLKHFAQNLRFGRRLHPLVPLPETVIQSLLQQGIHFSQSGIVAGVLYGMLCQRLVAKKAIHLLLQRVSARRLLDKGDVLVH
jgi:hypothetical protein